jgi:IMP cyclohydrolase
MVQQQAAGNFAEHLANNAYPGRGIVVGRDAEGAWIQIYWIMGRSQNSRNRIFVCADGALRTQAADPAKMSDPSLIIYHAMRTSGKCYIVSNGVQTDAIWQGLQAGRDFPQTLEGWHHEPDAPNYTPRISACVDLGGESARLWLSILMVSPFDLQESEHHFFRYHCVQPGFAYAITTYDGDGDPLPSFSSSPYIIELPGSAEEIAAHFWDALDADNKISLAVRRIDASSGEERIGITNRYQAV